MWYVVFNFTVIPIKKTHTKQFLVVVSLRAAINDIQLYKRFITPISCKYQKMNFFLKTDIKPNTFVSKLPSTLYKTTANPTTPRITTRTTTTTTTEPTTTTTTTTTTTSPPWICEDYDIAHCSDPEVKTLVCADDNLNYLCRKTCNLCEH